MDIISSADNSLVKTVGKLKTRKYRYETGKFVLEGYRLVKDAVARGKSTEFKIILSQSNAARYAGEFPQAVVLSDQLFEKLTDTVTSQGIMAIAPIAPFSEAPKSSFCLYLDRIRDPGNLGTIIRSAAACGITDIILDDCVDVYNPKTIRSSMSAYAHCDFILATPSVTDGYSIVCADMNGEDIRSAALKISGGPMCLVIGNEANGVSKELLSRADAVVSLPMCKGVESLNAAVSASVAMYAFKYFIK